ncbi:hypothetical protein PS15m_000784 [Mucor circinelloides]
MTAQTRSVWWRSPSKPRKGSKEAKDGVSTGNKKMTQSGSPATPVKAASSAPQGSSKGGASRGQQSGAHGRIQAAAQDVAKNVQDVEKQGCLHG